MNSNRQAVDRFLHDHDMHPEAVSIDETVRHMTEEMEQGLAGQPSSLAMIPTYIDTERSVPVGEKAVVLDAGGTNLRAALVSFQEDGSPIIEDFSKRPMPGTQGTVVGKEEFFSSLAALVEPLASRANTVGFCFSYPTEILPNRDGRLIHWSKEIQAPEVEGCLVGAQLQNALVERGIKEVPPVTVLNDTVATLLTGKAASVGRDWGAYVGFILGTGTNTCYVESNDSIAKAQGLASGGQQVINCESGSFACRHRGTADVMLGETTSKPETYWLEKMLSGGYFGALATQVMKLAGDKGLLSLPLKEQLARFGEISTKDADNYTHNPQGTNNDLVSLLQSSGSNADAERTWFLMDALLERAARLTAANLAAPVLKGQSGKGPLAPACLTVDGTTYYRYYRFESRVEALLRPYLAERDHYYETVRVEDAPLIGAAVAALTN
ncbi:MAG: hexokinase [Spirochaetales bacterium]|nr:hexokinase [Spirochaetales bacterium]